MYPVNRMDALRACLVTHTASWTPIITSLLASTARKAARYFLRRSRPQTAAMRLGVH
jgi:hypothetical protein